MYSTHRHYDRTVFKHSHWQGEKAHIQLACRSVGTPTADAPLSVRQQILLLGQLAFYTGVGYKTAMGMGMTRWIQNNL
jgi:hypothetical protein